MKRLTLFISCLLFLFACAGCHSNNYDEVLNSGNYYIVGDYEEHLTPYLWLNTEDNTFYLGPGSIVSYAENGSFDVKDGKVIAISQSTTFVFEIKDSKTLILIDNGDNEFFKLPENAEFVFCEDIR